MPSEYKDAILWILENYEILKSILEKEKMTKDELEEHINYAKEHKQYLLHSLLLFKICCNDSNKR